MATAAQPTAAEVRAALERILRSRCFEHAGRASEFLRFVVGRTLAGDDRLKGYTIAIQVFGRPREFDAQSDPLVRVEALRLRQRLAEYYAGEGAEERVRLELPRGGYAVKASYAFAEPSAGEWRRAVAAPQAGGTPLRTGARAGWMAATLLLVAAAGSIAVQQQAPVAEQAPAVSSDRAHRTKIAVVPLQNLTGTSDAERLAAGVTEEIMLRLDELDLFVIATQATRYGPDGALDGVLGTEHSYVLTGSVREHAGGARITVRIIEADNGSADLERGLRRASRASSEQPALQASIARDAAAAAAPFGPVFDAELALARRAAHTLELPDCQTRYRAFRRGNGPRPVSRSRSRASRVSSTRRPAARACVGRPRDAVTSTSTCSTPADRRRLAARAGAGQPCARRWSSTATTSWPTSRWRARSTTAATPRSLRRPRERWRSIPTNAGSAWQCSASCSTAYGDRRHGLELVARAQALSPRPRARLQPRLRVRAPARTASRARPWRRRSSMESPKWFITHVMVSGRGAVRRRAAAAEARQRLLALAPHFEAEAARADRHWRFDPALHDALLRGLRASRLRAPRAARRSARYARYGRVSSSDTCQSRAAIAGSFCNALCSAGLQSTK